MTPPIDRFSDVAEGYSKYRPRYPQALFEFIFSQVDPTVLVWDVGTGNGQVASVLADHFPDVIATDISATQLSHAEQKPNVTYRIGAAEDSGIEGNTINLITVAQAAHWFDRAGFGKEVDRVGAPNCLLAIWGYALFSAGSVIDPIIRHLYVDILDTFWDANRQILNDHYRTYDMPFSEIACPEFEMTNMWSADDVLGYLRTWSAVRKFRIAKGYDPVSDIEDALITAFEGTKIPCSTPVFLRAWRVHSSSMK